MSTPTSSEFRAQIGTDAPSPHELVRAGEEAQRAGLIGEARRCYEEALYRISEDGFGELAVRLFRWIAWTHATEGNSGAALDALEAAEAAATAIGDTHGLASALNTRAGTLFGLGDLDGAEPLFLRVRSLASEVGDRKLEAMADQNLGNVAGIRGDVELALSRFQSALAAYEALGEDAYVGPLLNNIGRLRYDLKEYVTAGQALARARDICLRVGDRHHLMIVDVNRARVMLKLDECEAALATSESAHALAVDSGDDRWLADIHLVWGAAEARLGRHEEAARLLERAETLARRREDPKTLAEVLLELAGSSHALGRNQDTLRQITEARVLFEGLRARRDLIDVADRLAELERFFLQIVTQWGQSIESKDAYTQGHCTRVADYACMLAEATGMSEDELRWFRMGALLHDVGKVVVPLEILNKPGRLDDDEWAVMSSHSVAGVELLEGIEFPWDVRPMIRHHHERFEGGGYPDKIAGDAIPFEARILTIADIYDALTTTRSYRPGFPHEKAMAILASESGKAIDPELFELFRAEVAPRLAEQLEQEPESNVLPFPRVA